MKRFKNHKGFTFIELVMAVAIMGICLTALFTLQSNILVQAVERTDVLNRLFATKNVLIEWLQKPRLPETLKKIDKIAIKDPATLITCQAQEIHPDSSLGRLGHFYAVRVTSEWERDATPYYYRLVYYVFMPPEEKKKNEAPST